MPPKSKTLEFPALPGIVFDKDSVYGIAVGDELETATCEGWELVASAPALERFLMRRTRKAQEKATADERELVELNGTIAKLEESTEMLSKAWAKAQDRMVDDQEIIQRLGERVASAEDELVVALTRNAEMGDEAGKVRNEIGDARWREIVSG